MPKVGATFAAMHLNADHAVRAIFLLLNRLISGWLKETWPTGARIKFGLRGKQRLITHCTGVGALFVVIPEPT